MLQLCALTRVDGSKEEEANEDEQSELSVLRTLKCTMIETNGH